MGKRSRVSETSSLIIYYILIINTCCDISLINCDIHEMRQQHVNRLADSAKVNANEIDFKIDPIELQAHIMTGLNMTKTPDADLVSQKTPKIPRNLPRERNFFHVPSWSSETQGVSTALDANESARCVSQKTCLRGEWKKNSCCAKLAINQSSGLFCCRWNDILRWSEWLKALNYAMRSKTAEVQERRVDGICFRNFWKSCKFGTNKWVGLYWIHFDKKALSFGQKPFNVPSKWSKYAKKIVQSCPRITGFRRLSISSQSTKPRNLLESFHQKAEWIN